ncbi:hypothetical protein BTM29_11970 [Companilactobacillus allii]|uniref:Multidrug ABC transporter permease n=1 Tax=Companilactobacillus allii TaxID=1847728 RepID=A0A1P8Q6D2_9LACO|nr:hypothetical protein BTM29_11970 [Companilactobacillus allii]
MRVFNINFKFLIGLILTMIGSSLNLYVPILVGKAISLKEILISGTNNSIYILKIIILLLLTTILTSIGGYIISREGDKTIKEIREKVNTHLLYLPTSYFDNSISGQLSSRVINDVSIIKEFITIIIPQNLSGIITLFGALSILVYTDWKLTFVICISFPIYALLTIPVANINEKLIIILQSELSKLSGVVTEFLRNIRTVKLNNAESIVVKNINGYINNMYKISLRGDLINSVVAPLQSVISFGVILSIILYGGLRVNNGTLSMSSLVTIVMYLVQIIQPINTVSSFYTNFKECKGSLSKVSEIIQMSTENDIPFNMKLPSNYLVNSIRFENVSFSYENDLILKNVNIKFERNKKIAIVGPSGSGKTTIINLLTRLYTINIGGKIILNEDISSEDILIYDWRKLFGVVSQENTVLTGTIKDNLIFGLNYIPNNRELDDAIKASNLWDDIKDLPNGIETLVGEQGVQFSGGQRQRLQIARAYIKNPKVLILDEATSSLDPSTESLVSEALRKVMSGKMIVAVAHRLSTVMDADEIYFVDKHTILDHGKHSDLLSRLPEYKEFVKKQFGSIK